MQRRTLLRAGGVAVLAALPLPLVFRSAARRRSSTLRRDPQGLLDLPEGFSYRVLERAGDRMTDGFAVPGRPDGMGCFALGDGKLALMRNHELDRRVFHDPFGPSAPPEAFDRSAGGGVTRLVVSADRFERVSSNLVLTGTLRNCAGGHSPWGWLSCEETVATGHGYVFLCRPEATRVEEPNRITAYGRFNHEAACVDPNTLVAYLTEDRGDGCLYRFVPDDKARPFVGRLQAMKIVGKPRFDTSELEPGRPLAVEWVEVPEPDPRNDTVREQAIERGAALVRRGEGAFFADAALHVSATNGGARGLGQVLRLVTDGTDARNQRATIEVVAASRSVDVLDGPDNVVVAPNGDVIIAEDGGGDQYVRGLTREGRFYDVARNAKSSGEFAGVCFSPDGRALFVNMQIEGVTLVVMGPWQELRQSARVA